MLKIISWNCQGAFRNKFENVLKIKPDILVILECEPIEKLKFGYLLPRPNDYAWYSDDGKKGIGIFSFCDYKFDFLSIHNPEFRYIIPFRVYNDSSSFYLFSVWAMDHKTSPLDSYIGQVWNAVNFYSSLLRENCVLIGDFNSNKIWDGKERSGNHSAVVMFLEDRDITSLYHHFYEENQGEERCKTFYLHRNINKPYHIDYVFTSRSFLTIDAGIEIGKFEDWIPFSDHVPLILEISIPAKHVDYSHSFYDFVSKDLEGYSAVFREKFFHEIEGLKNKAYQTDLSIFDKSELYQLLGKLKKMESLYLDIL